MSTHAQLNDTDAYDDHGQQRPALDAPTLIPKELVAEWLNRIGPSDRDEVKAAVSVQAAYNRAFDRAAAPHGDDRAVQRETWQPIATAPKDGTVVDLWLEDHRRTDCQWKAFGTDHFGWVDLQTDCWIVQPQPTHWMKVDPPALSAVTAPVTPHTRRRP